MWHKAAAVFALLALTMPALAAPPSSGSVRLAAATKAAREDVDLMPKVVPNATVSAAVAARINAALRREDARAIAAAHGCHASYQGVEQENAGGKWMRSVSVTMSGPRYLAYQVSDSYYCGGPYPNDGLRSDFVYDLATGAPVNWLRLFPKGAVARGSTAPAGAPLGVIAWSALTKRAVAQAQPECREVFTEGGDTSFSIGLDGTTGSLIAMPVDFPHVIQACAEEVVLDGAALRRLGFAPALREALARAQGQPQRR